MHLQIQYSLYHNSNGIFDWNLFLNPKICVELQNTPNSQSNSEEEEQS